jgi:hypothetical protein
MSQVALDLLRKHLAAYYLDDDVKFRNEILGFSKNLISRVKSVIAVATRKLNKSAAKGEDGMETAGRRNKRLAPEDLLKDDDEAREVLHRHRSFLKWYMEFLQSELIPTASYQRHITALKALLPVLRVGKRMGGDVTLDPEVTAAVFSDSSWIRLIMDLTMDAFDDVREIAATILGMFSQDDVRARTSFSENGSTLLDLLQEVSRRAAVLASKTGRADYGNGAARLQGLLTSWLSDSELRLQLIENALIRLEAKLSRAAVDLGHAAVEDSVHGDFASLGYVLFKFDGCQRFADPARYIWRVLGKLDNYTSEDSVALQQAQRRIFKSCELAWNLVRHVLCDDSPEGLLPEEMEDIEGLDTRDLLSYSFRAIHESRYDHPYQSQSA